MLKKLIMFLVFSNLRLRNKKCISMHNLKASFGKILKICKLNSKLCDIPKQYVFDLHSHRYVRLIV